MLEFTGSGMAIDELNGDVLREALIAHRGECVFLMVACCHDIVVESEDSQTPTILLYYLGNKAALLPQCLERLEPILGVAFP